MAIQDSKQVRCPFCGQVSELYVDPQTAGHYTQDCDLCCHPWSIRVSREESGNLQLEIGRGN